MRANQDISTILVCFPFRLENKPDCWNVLIGTLIGMHVTPLDPDWLVHNVIVTIEEIVINFQTQ